MMLRHLNLPEHADRIQVCIQLAGFKCSRFFLSLVVRALLPSCIL